jgi:hypothetical protein
MFKLHSMYNPLIKITSFVNFDIGKSDPAYALFFVFNYLNHAIEKQAEYFLLRS